MPKKSKISISESLNTIDLFEEPIRLNMEGDVSLKSSCGGILSLIIILFLLVQVIIQMVAITDRKSPTVVQMNEYSDNPSRVYLNRSNNFIFAVVISQNDQPMNMSNNSLVSFAATYSQQLRFTDGSLKKSKSRIRWVPCTQDHFPSNVFSSDTFSTYSLKYAYCPVEIDFNDPTTNICPDEIKARNPTCKTPLDLSLEGNFLSLDFEYLQFQINLCDSADATTIKDLQCTSGDKAAIFNSSEIKFNLYYSNNVIDPVNFETPNKTYLDTMYWNINPSVAQTSDIFIDTVTVQDYSDYISTDAYQNRTFYQVSSDKVKNLQAFKQTSLIKCNFRRSSINMVTIRKYAKILDVISNIGGISKVLLVVAAIFAISYTRYKSQVILSNNLYNFDTSHRKSKKNNNSQKKIKANDKAEENKTKKTMKQLTYSSGGFKKKQTLSLDESVKNYFESQKIESQALRYGEWEYFKGFMHKLCCRRNLDEKLAEKARKQIVKDLDIVKIVGKLKEIDKLKCLLLNDYQRETFNFTDKPLITLKEDEPIENNGLNNRELTDFGDTPLLVDSPDKKEESIGIKKNNNAVSKYSKLYLAYTRLKQDNDPRNWKYNKKLLSMIGEDLKKVFAKIDEVMGGDSDPKKFEEVVSKIINEDKTHTESLLNQNSPHNV